MDCENKVIIDGNSGMIYLHGEFFTEVVLELENAEIHEVLSACADSLKRKKDEVKKFIETAKNEVDESCYCYDFEYSLDGSRKWCIHCGKEKF